MPRSRNPVRYPGWLHDFAATAKAENPMRIVLSAPDVEKAYSLRRMYYSFCLALQHNEPDKDLVRAASAYRVTVERGGIPVPYGSHVKGPIDVVFTNYADVDTEYTQQLLAQRQPPSEQFDLPAEAFIRGPSDNTRRRAELVTKLMVSGLSPDEQKELDALQ